MGQTDWVDEIAGSMNHGTGWSRAEMELFRGAAFLAGSLTTVLIGALRVADAVVEAWPLPFSRVRPR